MRDYAKRSSFKKNQSKFNGAWVLAILFIWAVCFAGYEIDRAIQEKWSTNQIPVAPKIMPIHKPIIKKETSRKIVTKKIEHKNPIKQVLKSPDHKKKAAPVVTTNPADIQPKYDFYQLLPKMTVKVPSKDQATIASTNLP